MLQEAAISLATTHTSDSSVATLLSITPSSGPTQQQVCITGENLSDCKLLWDDQLKEDIRLIDNNTIEVSDMTFTHLITL